MLPCKVSLSEEYPTIYEGELKVQSGKTSSYIRYCMPSGIPHSHFISEYLVIKMKRYRAHRRLTSPAILANTKPIWSAEGFPWCDDGRLSVTADLSSAAA